MIVTMLQSRAGSPHGHDVVQYEKGVSYDVTDSLGKEFIAAKFAVEGDKSAKAPIAGKD